MAEQYKENQRRTIILASGSPRRRELLGQMGYEFTVRTTDADENVSGAPGDVVAILAQRKAEAARVPGEDAVIIAADTLVSLDDRALGKPKDDEDAKRMLKSLSGRGHEVFTGICVLDEATGEMTVDAVRTGVIFRSVSDEEIAAYVATGEPRDKAGAYAIQGGAGAFVVRFDGSFNNVIGLPTERLKEILDSMMA